MDKKYKHTITFRMVQRKSKKADPTRESPIFADISFGSKRFRYYSGYRIAQTKWDGDAHRVKRNSMNKDGESASDINRHLDRIKVAIDNVFTQFALKQEEITPIALNEELKNMFKESVTARQTVEEVYQAFIDQRKKELKENAETATLTRGSLKKHITMLNHVKGFQKGLYFEDITDEWLSKFELYMIRKNLSNNYVSKSITDLKSFLNWAYRKGHNHNLLFREYKTRFKDETKSDDTINLYALTDEEIAAIRDFPTNRKAIDRTRDMFIFACYTGMRFSELITLRWSNIIGDIIDIVAPKTNKRQRFALPQEAQRVLKKYPRRPDQEDPTVFPTISNQKYNHNLKEVGRLGGLTKDWITERQVGRKKTRETKPKYELLTSHVARRTFVTMCLRRGMTDADIRSVTGHSATKVMLKYAKLDDDAKRKKMDILNDGEVRTLRTIFDCDVTAKELKALGLPKEEQYFAKYEGDTVSANAHLALLFNLRGNTLKRAEYLKLLPVDKLSEVLDLIIS